MQILLYSGMVMPISRDGCHRKGSLSLTVTGGQGHAVPCRVTQGSTRVSEPGWARGFTLVSVGRNRHASRLRTAQFE